MPKTIVDMHAIHVVEISTVLVILPSKCLSHQEPRINPSNAEVDMFQEFDQDQ